MNDAIKNIIEQLRNKPMHLSEVSMPAAARDLLIEWLDDECLRVEAACEAIEEAVRKEIDEQTKAELAKLASAKPDGSTSP